MSRLTLGVPRELPEVGDRIVMRWPHPDNPNNWIAPGVVRAVVDREAIVIRRRTRKGMAYELITALQWRMYAPERNGGGGLHLVKKRRRHLALRECGKAVGRRVAEKSGASPSRGA
jgi:hypothetical protein